MQVSENNSDFGNIIQLDGKLSILDELIQTETESFIPVHISQYRNQMPILKPKRTPYRTTIKRNSVILQSIELPVILNINPRSLYNKKNEFRILVEEYSADLITVSESWSRDNLPLEELLQLDNYKIITNVKQREFRGGKPAIIVNQEKYHVKPLCPDPLTVPPGVECVWALLTPKNTTP